MKNNMSLTMGSVCFIFSMLILYSCKKYPQDDKWSFSESKVRLTKKDWFVKSYYVNNFDSINCNYSYTICGGSSEYYNLKNKKIRFHPEYYVYEQDLFSNWKYLENKQQIAFNLNKSFCCNQSCNGNGGFLHFFPHTYSENWTILKLTNEALIIKMNTDLKEIKIEFSH